MLSIEYKYNRIAIRCTWIQGLFISFSGETEKARKKSSQFVYPFHQLTNKQTDKERQTHTDKPSEIF